ncbi:prepilin peptidase [Rubellimicrobium roseum]|nr:prepilin peptidase [Rubellimicrobium roseum]
MVPLLLALPILLWIAWTDVMALRIRNSAVAAAVALFVVTLPLVGWPEAGWRLLAAAVVFLTGFALFAARLMGGGDVKMGAALMLFVPSGTHSQFALLFSAAMLMGILALEMLRRLPALRRAGPVSLRARGTFPMGLAFALGAVLHVLMLAASA